ncbi:MAG: HAD family hydrolase [Candidatus Micrarchaeota archaeon]|nr:HAD family hydrolase [Candidatus Micrarchaeota archaeon]
MATNYGYATGFAKAGLKYGFDVKEVWHLRGFDKFNSSKEAVKALLALNKAKQQLKHALDKSDPQGYLISLISEYLNEADYALAENIVRTYKQIFNSEEGRKLIRQISGAEEAVAELRNKGYRLAVFTNSSSDSVKRDMPYWKQFEFILSEDEVPRRKPYGDGIRIAMSKAGVLPDETAYIGDAASDISAARDAGCKAIAVLSGMGTAADLEKANPDMIFEDLLELAKFMKQIPKVINR